jgi:RNA polymerase sigma factor (sigma-70 family)
MMLADRLRQDELEPLLRRFVDQGDSVAVQEFVARTRPRLYSVARKIVDASEAHDAVQEAYLSMLRKGSADLGAPIMGWLITAVVRIAYHRKAATNRQAEVLERLARPRDDDVRPVDNAARAEEARIVQEEVRRLPPVYRDVLVLHYMHELTTSQIAELLGTPVATVKTRLQRGRSLLQPRLASRVALGVCGFLLACGDRARAGAGLLTPVRSASVATRVVIASVLAGTSALVLAIAWHGDGEIPARSARAGSAGSGDAMSVAEPPQPADPPPPSDTVANDSAPPGSSPPPASTLEAAARHLFVSAEALAAAADAEAKLARGNRMQVPLHRREAEEALDRLRAFRDGGEAYRAVVALIRARRSGPWFEELAGATWVPDLGLEELLIAAGKDAEPKGPTMQAVVLALGAVDTPRSRDYLLQVLSGTPDGMAALGAAKALGRWGERRAVPAVATWLRKPEADGARVHLLVSLGGMGGPEAVALLQGFVRHGSPDETSYALSALAKADRALARAEATALLAAGDLARLPKPAVEMIERLARE